MTDADWSIRFHQLLKLNLIEMPDNYYQDDLYFDDPDGLN